MAQQIVINSPNAGPIVKLAEEPAVPVPVPSPQAMNDFKALMLDEDLAGDVSSTSK